MSNLRERVLFEPVVRSLVDRGGAVFVEASPHPVLAMAVQETGEVADRSVVAVGSLRRDDGGAGRFLTSLAEAFVAGASVDWSVSFAGSGARRVDLPTYAFQHQRYWLEGVSVGGEIQDGTADETDAAFWDAVEREDLSDLAEVLDVPDDTAAVEAWLPTLSAWRRGRRKQMALDSWRYRITWRANALPSAPRLSGTWLIVSPGGDAPMADAPVDEMRRALEAAGAEVSVSEEFDGAALAEASGVVSLLAWDEESALRSTLRLVQARGESGSAAALWVLTRGAAAVGADDAISAQQTSVWALGQIVGLEQPAAWGGLVDVPAVWDERVAASLAGVLAAGVAGGGEDQVAVRSSGVYGRRLVRAPLGANAAP
ncbi:acyltransferase domain-containing protein, partial [Streptomyces sp. NPDC001500]